MRTRVPVAGAGRFQHQALFYEGEGEFVDRAVKFIGDGLDAGEAVLVLVVPPKIDMLRSALGGAAENVLFADMSMVGRNPARIIPVWREFLGRHGAARGIGEPVWAGRTREELAEALRHEALLNLALSDAEGRILCPYDTSALEPRVIDEVRRTHPLISDGVAARPSAAFSGIDEISRPFGEPLSEPPVRPQEMSLTVGNLAELRSFVARSAIDFGLDAGRTTDLVLSVGEVATNSLRHGGGRGLFRLWRDGDTLVCEVRDGGRIDDPLVGRQKPAADGSSGFGLWIVNQLCDLVQVRSFETGSVVRMHMLRN